jgi:MarR family transcriptional regulator, lower aerobic nicotinate degradation pathway regulator
MSRPSIESLYKKPGYLIRRLQQMSVSIFSEELSDFEITPVQYATLAAVAACPGLDHVGVSQTVGLDRTTVTGIIDRLEAKGLLARSPSKTDRRAKLLTVTEDGLVALNEMGPATLRVQTRILQPLAPAERKVFMSLLERVVWEHNEDSRVPVDRKKVSNLRG